jgi:hypothetical protein
MSKAFKNMQKSAAISMRILSLFKQIKEVHGMRSRTSMLLTLTALTIGAALARAAEPIRQPVTLVQNY